MRLNMGSGGMRLGGYTSVDFNPTIGDGQDVIQHDLRQPLPLSDNSVEAIFASHIIEHFWYKEAQDILRDWHRVLMKGGTLDIWTIDFELMILRYSRMKALGSFTAMDEMNEKIFNRDELGQHHHSIHSARSMAELLYFIGFTKVEILDNDKDFPFGTRHQGIQFGVRGTK